MTRPPFMTSPTLRLSPPIWILVVLALSTALKLAWAGSSAGSIDAFSFFKFAHALHEWGLSAVYQASPVFNHTPLTSLFISALNWAAAGNFAVFTFLLRSASILADIALVLGLLRMRAETGRPPWWALALFAASPVSIMVSGFHGNVDPIMTVLLFFAGFACWRGRPLTCAVLFALACNVKIVPVLFAPVFFCFWMKRGGGWRFAITTAAVLLAGSVLPLLECPAADLRNVFGYGSTWGVWGVSYWLRQSGWEAVQKIDFHDLTVIQARLATLLKMVVVAGSCALAWRRRGVAGEGIFHTLAGAWLLFFTFAPGIGVQYMVWLAPFVLLLSPRWFAAVTATSSIFLFAFYHSVSGGQFPWVLAMPRGPETPFWSAVGNVAWLTIVAMLAVNWRALWRVEPAEVSANEPTETKCPGRTPLPVLKG